MVTTVEASDRFSRLNGLVRRSRLNLVLPALVALATLFISWQIFVEVVEPKPYLVPSPGSVWGSLVNDWPRLVQAGRITFGEAALGLVLGILIGLVLGTVMAYSVTVERVLYPIVITIRATPIIAIAPLFIIWWGFGIMPKAFVATLATFFPVLIASITGLRSGDQEIGDLLASLHAGRFETFWRFRFPSSLPYLFAGLRIAVNLAIIGAIVGELVGAQDGLGLFISVSAADLRTDRVFAAAFVLMSMGVLAQIILALLESRVLHWHSSKLGFAATPR